MKEDAASLALILALSPGEREQPLDEGDQSGVKLPAATLWLFFMSSECTA